MDSPEQRTRRLIIFAAAVVAVLWLLFTIIPIALLFVAAFILTIALNAPVEAATARGLPRGLAVAAVLGTVLITTVGVGVIVIPRIAEQVVALAEGLPGYVQTLDRTVDRLLAPYPEVADAIALDEQAIGGLLPSVGEVLARVGSYSLSALSGVVLLIVLVSIVIFTLLDPLPLARTYLRAFPSGRRPAAERAFIRGRRGVVGWVRANLIVGAVESVAVFVALTLLGVPGALVWAALAFFAELVPKVGAYLMAVPPIVVALAVEPMLGLAVLIFYVVLNEIAGDVVAPAVRSKEMRLHPVFLLFVFLAMAAAFGIVGALISTPLAAFVAAFYDEFWAARRASDAELEPGAVRMLRAEGVAAEVQ